MKPLILVGGGGHCLSVIDAAESAGLVIAGILDMPAKVGSTLAGYKVVGTDADIPRLAAGHSFIITIGDVGRSSALRTTLAELIADSGGSFATIVASTARISPHATVGEGSVVLHGACINAGAIVGRHCIVNTLACVDHEAQVGSFSHISTGAMINGQARVGERCMVGSNATVAQCVNIVGDTILGASSLALHHITTPGTYVGVPAKRL